MKRLKDLRFYNWPSVHALYNCIRQFVTCIAVIFFVATTCEGAKCKSLLQSISSFISFKWDYNLDPVRHLGQMHFRPEAENNPGAFDAIAHSQFSIAQTILNTPNAEVFAEGVYDNTITSEEYEKQLKDPKSAAHLCNAIFPSGFPTSFDLLTERQKFALVRLGAPEVLWLLGAIIHVHGTIDSSVRMLIDIEAEAIEKYGSWDKAYQLSPEFRYEIGTEREEVAEAHITSFMRSRSYKGQPILLVFGSDHDFSAFAQKRTWLNVLSALSKGQIK